MSYKKNNSNKIVIIVMKDFNTLKKKVWLTYDENKKDK